MRSLPGDELVADAKIRWNHAIMIRAHPALLLAGVPVHVIAARLGHADPAVTCASTPTSCAKHAAGVGDIFAQAVKASVSTSASQTGKDDQ
jgi:hypothetical protein